jgi:magnesium-dependent phosphatase 1
MKLVVFDLDFTLWDAGGQWIDQSIPPFVMKNGIVYDSTHTPMVLYPDSLSVLNLLKENNILMAAASRTYQPSWAFRLLELYDIKKYFDYLKIFPDTKIRHFNQLRKESGIPFQNMVFFDDEMRNIDDVSTLGVKAVLVNDGISLELIHENVLR